MSELTYEQKLVDYATAPKATAGIISQIENGHFVNHWCGKLRGEFVQTGLTWKASTKQQALESARLFRQQCWDEAKAKGLLPV
ncbi:hypothetical protein ASE80_16760 [Pseudomonas sp. Leaf15]|uniref:hypothetical protein n=1 Tax=unclassified Pseudomonas TaxID=196821 RepID=UPI00070338B8|nr:MULTISPECIES: hypothetical protein [unclassified Pseudomonas]KQM46408.1 hypothetical protein ASE80_16760 [Pseudomonas sp. Leaf15]RAH01660.1 hypothetical protein DJ480_16815 [Pseudomonas sp. Leaf98]